MKVPLFNFNVKFPSKSVEIPWFVSLIRTVATVLIKETNQGISTDLDGNFTLKLNKGTFTIQVSYIGFKTIEKNIYLDKDNLFTIVLYEDDNVLDEVLVSAVRATSRSSSYCWD